MKIKNIEGLSPQALQFEVNNGGKFVVFEYTFSILVMTFRRSTNVYFIKSTENHWNKSLPFTMISLVFGWWGFPWGFIYTPMALYTNLKGGKDITKDILIALQNQ